MQLLSTSTDLRSQAPPITWNALQDLGVAENITVGDTMTNVGGTSASSTLYDRPLIISFTHTNPSETPVDTSADTCTITRARACPCTLIQTPPLDFRLLAALMCLQARASVSTQPLCSPSFWLLMRLHQAVSPPLVFFSTLFSLFAPLKLDPHTATNSPKSNLLNKAHAPPLLQDSRARLMHVLLQTQDCNQLRPGNIVPGVYNNSKVRAEEIKGSFNRELSWLLSYAGHSSRSRGQYRCEPQVPSTVLCWRS